MYIITYYNYSSELYAADSDDKHIVPVIYESINYQLDNAMGVKYIISGLEQMHFIPNMDDYSFSLDKLVCTLGQYGEGERRERRRKGKRHTGKRDGHIENMHVLTSI